MGFYFRNYVRVDITILKQPDVLDKILNADRLHSCIYFVLLLFFEIYV